MLVIEMTKLIIKIAVLVVPYFNDAILHPECITEILAHFMVVDLYDPVFDVFSIKELHPFPVIGLMRSKRTDKYK